MSRRVTFFVLAASVALIATPAAADPECFGQPCHLPEAVEPPPAAVPMPEADDATAPEARAAVTKPASVRALPKVVATPAVAAVPEEAPQPMARRPLPSIKTVADEASVPRQAGRLAPRSFKDAPDLKDAAAASLPPSSRVASVAPTDYARSSRVSSPDPSYVVGYNTAPVGGIVVVVPGMTYAAGHRPTYLFAPGAKIISIDSDD